MSRIDSGPGIETPQDTFAGNEDDRRDRSSGPILAALAKAEQAFAPWQANCDMIDEIYSRVGVSFERLLTVYGGETAWRDNELDLFWASFEVMKPAVYCRPPRPAVKPRFSDGDKTKSLTAELLERVSVATFDAAGMDDVMREVRDDVLFSGRGVLWLRYETEGGQRVCVEHLDRKDFLHETARTWAGVGWVAGGFWLDRDEMQARFGDKPGITKDILDMAKYTAKRDGEVDESERARSRKCRVWEVWHKADNKVYWVTEGVDVLLDSEAPQTKLSGFFPCPKPAYATRQRRSLIPLPDWNRYAVHFGKINDMTARIYALLESVKMKGLIPAGGDIGNAVELALSSEDDSILIPVPGAALLATGGSANLVQWLPLAELAAAITGLIEARAQVIANFYELSGISDIMRGATEAEETLGAQQLKSQYGSVRVREKIDELQRAAAAAVKIAAEIEAEHFTQKTLLDMAQMAIPSKADLKKRVKEIEDAAREELEGLAAKAEEATANPQAQEVDPAQAQQAFEQAQQQALAKYGPMLQEAQQQVPVEDVMALLRDDKARAFAFEVESDSTIMTDELQEKASRNEFLSTFTNAVPGFIQMAGMGEQAAVLGGEMLKFTLAPYRAGRQLDTAIDSFIEAAPEMAQAAAAASGAGDDGLAEANNKLAEAETLKAQAAMAKVEADTGLKQIEMQRKMMEMQSKAQADQQKAAEAMEKLRQSGAESEAKLAETQAKVDNLNAQTAAIFDKLGIDWAKLDLDARKATTEQINREQDRAVNAERDAVDADFRAREADRADMGESRAERQQSFSEQQAIEERNTTDG